MAKVTITATVNFPCYVQVEIDENATEDEKREAILNQADHILETSSIDPIIHECSDEDLID
jgi:hypothetical protein